MALALGLICAAGNAATNEPAASALVDRIGGAGASERFVLTLDEGMASDSCETFVIDACAGKPRITGSTLSALTTGIGWYLNHYANINLTWNYPTADLLNAGLPLPSAAERHSTDIRYRHYMNYCTFSYSATTWTWERWQQEIDWMALRGINMPLQIVGVEEVWRRTLTKYGYDKDEINRFVAGPAYQAWFQMGNVEGIGGPNPDWWYERQAQLGRQIVDRMRELGMTPVLPGVYFVPSSLSEKTGMKTYATGSWCNHPRPHIPDVRDGRFADFARTFYSTLDSILGETDFYSMDPFHEGDGALPPEYAADEVYGGLYKTLEASHPGAKWVIQHWLWNPSQWRSLANVPVGKLVVLDLFADARPHWDEFGDHDVVFSTIFNFGGRTGLFGRLATTAEGFDKARRHATVRGIGATPEGIEQTPIIYDHLFELPWHDTIPPADQWVDDYTVRRYSKADEHARRAWNLVLRSALACPHSEQGPHEAIVCARPSLDADRVSSWGRAEIFYEPAIVMTAAKELLQADIEHPNYNYDLVDIARQALTDYSKTLLGEIKAAHDAGDPAAFDAAKERFLGLMLDIDDVLATEPGFMLGTWTQRSRRMADEVAGTGEADRDWLDFDNARTLITTWHDENMAVDLHEYAFREWSGMLRDFYYPRWKAWFDAGMKAPEGGWYRWEHDRIRAAKAYPETPAGTPREVVARVLKKYAD